MPPVQGLDTPAYLFPRMKEWLLILSIFYRLYTSVIPLVSEIWALKVSCATRLSPTTIFSQRAVPVHPCSQPGHASGGVPGVEGLGGYLGGLYRVLPRHPPRTIFSHIPRLRPYPRPNEANFRHIHEVSQIRARY